MSKREFKAIVFSGLGEGEFYVNLYARSLRTALGFTPYPGTLNLRIVSRDDVRGYLDELKGLRPLVIEPPKIQGVTLGKVLAYPATLNATVPVYIVRPELTTYKDDVIEVISEVRLRDLLNLSDGSEVLISVGDP